jgi:hypothetical protein
MIAMTQHPDWLTRYVAGQEDRVWHEMRQLGARVREPAFAPEAQAVCDEMAHRARSNIETLVARLREQGYRFHQNDDEQTPTEPYTPPGAKAQDLLNCVFRYREQWKNYRSTEQTLGHERIYFLTWTGVYTDLDDVSAFTTLVERVEATIANENAATLSVMTQVGFAGEDGHAAIERQGSRQ